ncbi:hypothetical protein DFQ30_004094 [Apophysomyces sp. BC1015]|nr:hypothetical protein DFQ30_004094 [Apophysomyces sp. BC1015]
MYTPNITPDEKYGLGRWSSDDFYRAMHTGRGKNGELLYPGFPFTSYTKVTRADSDAIYAYLRSVTPVAQPSREHALRFPFNQRNMLIGWRTLFFREGEYKPDPTKSVEWNRGAYLVEGLGHCGMCHTSRRGAVFGPMAEVVHNSLQYMTDDDIRAMSTYLKTIPQKKEAPEMMQLETSTAFGKALFEQGKKLYSDQCAQCHSENGLGHPPHFPPLANNQSVQMQSAVNPIRMVLNGGYPPSTQLNPEPYGMPPFAHSMSDREVAAVVTYLRMAWGNKGTPVSPQQVNELRSAPLD